MARSTRGQTTENIIHSGFDHIAYSAIGAGIAVEWSGAGSLPWQFYAIILGAAVALSFINHLLRYATEQP